MSTFNEQDHPRAADGTFRDKPHTSAGIGLNSARPAAPYTVKRGVRIPGEGVFDMYYDADGNEIGSVQGREYMYTAARRTERGFLEVGRFTERRVANAAMRYAIEGLPPVDQPLEYHVSDGKIVFDDQRVAHEKFLATAPVPGLRIVCDQTGEETVVTEVDAGLSPRSREPDGSLPDASLKTAHKSLTYSPVSAPDTPMTRAAIEVWERELAEREAEQHLSDELRAHADVFAKEIPGTCSVRAVDAPDRESSILVSGFTGGGTKPYRYMFRATDSGEIAMIEDMRGKRPSQAAQQAEKLIRQQSWVEVLDAHRTLQERKAQHIVARSEMKHSFPDWGNGGGWLS